MRFVTQVSAPFGISPNGRDIVFSAADSSGNIALWVRTLDDPTPRKLDGSDNGTHPAVSPDGQWVAFIEGDRALSKVRLSGGSRMALAVLPGVSASLSWESNDAILCEVIAPNREIMRVAASGGTPTVAIPFDSATHEVRQRRPLVVRDAGVVLYRGTTSTDSSFIVMYSLHDRRRSRLSFSGMTFSGDPLAVINGLLVYSASGSLWGIPIDLARMRATGEAVQLSQRAAAYSTGTAVAVSESGTLVYDVPSGSREAKLELIDFAGNRTELRSPNRFGPLRYSPDGHRIAVTIAAGTAQGPGSSSDIWIIDVASKEATQVTNTGDATQPEWSADGKRLIYIARSKGESEVWSTPIDGSSSPARLVDADGFVISPSATPDGRAIVVSRLARGTSNIVLVRIPLDPHSKTDTLVSPTGPNGVRAIQARVSPDGRLVAYADRTGRSVHVKELDGNADIQISTDGGCCPLWGPDSRRVYFLNGRQLIAADLQTVPALSLKRRTTSTGFWATDPGRTAFDDVYYDLSPDGKKFVAVTSVENDTRVFVAYNWADELRREWKAGARK
jgi:Tol biopolymer transport system component